MYRACRRFFIKSKYRLLRRSPRGRARARLLLSATLVSVTGWVRINSGGLPENCCAFSRRSKNAGMACGSRPALTKVCMPTRSRSEERRVGKESKARGGEEEWREKKERQGSACSESK